MSNNNIKQPATTAVAIPNTTLSVSLPTKFVEAMNALEEARVQGYLAQQCPNPMLAGLMRADAIFKMQQILSDPDISGIYMSMQGHDTGFRTDKDKDGGYPVQVVVGCLIDAGLTGLYPVGNEFNIIAGKMYPAKNGINRLLNEIPGLKRVLTPAIPVLSHDGKSAECHVLIKWSMAGGPFQSEDYVVQVRANAGSTADAIVGKAVKKAETWLLNTIKGLNLVEADATEIQSGMQMARPSRFETAATAGTEEAVTATSDRLADALTAKGAPFTADEVRAYVTRDGDIYMEDYVLAHLGEVLTAMSQEDDNE